VKFISRVDAMPFSKLGIIIPGTVVIPVQSKFIDQFFAIVGVVVLWSLEIGKSGYLQSKWIIAILLKDKRLIVSITFYGHSHVSQMVLNVIFIGVTYIFIGSGSAFISANEFDLSIQVFHRSQVISI